MREAAVIVPVCRGPEGELRVVLVRRSAGGVHGGDLAFPGGKRDSTDASLLTTALRETREEIGLADASVTVLARLPEVRTRGSGFCIAPFLARVVRPPAWERDEREIAEVIETPLADLDGHGPGGDAAREPGASPEPAYRVGPYRLWGATYRILRPLVPRLLGGEWPV